MYIAYANVFFEKKKRLILAEMACAAQGGGCLRFGIFV